MKIEVPLSPYDEKTPTTQENVHSRSTTGRKATPFRVKKLHDTSPSVRSFRLDRFPLSDIGNGGSTVVTDSVGPKDAPDLISLTPLNTGNNKENSSDAMPTLVTGSVKKSGRVKESDNAMIDLLSLDQTCHVGSEHHERTIQELREQVGFLEEELARSRQQGGTVNDSGEDALRQELSELKDFIVEMDSEKRRLENLLIEERNRRIGLEREVALQKESVATYAMKEAAMQGRISSLKAMVRMVSLEKEKLTQFTMMESSLIDRNAAGSSDYTRH